MFIFLIVSVEKKNGWVIETAASTSGLGPGSVPTLFFALLLSSWLQSGRCCLSPPTLALSFQKGPKRSWESELRETKQKREGLPGMREGRLLLSPPYSTPSSPHSHPHLALGGGGGHGSQRHLWGQRLSQGSLLPSRNRGSKEGQAV